MWALGADATDRAALALLCSVKARDNPLLGLWWRFQAFVGAGSPMRTVAIVIGLYVVYRIMTIALGQFGHAQAAGIASIGWLLFCVYTWVAPAMFAKMLAREMQSVSLKPDY